MAEILAAGEIVDRVLTLQGEERIFIQIDKDSAKDLRYIMNKNQGLVNMFMSYMNVTTEAANTARLETFIDRAAKLLMEQNDKIDEIGERYLGRDLLGYLQDATTEQVFSIDVTRNVIIIHHRSAMPTGEFCTCGSPTCPSNMASRS